MTRARSDPGSKKETHQKRRARCVRAEDRSSCHVWGGQTASFLLLVVRMLLVAMPGAPSSVRLLLVASLTRAKDLTAKRLAFPVAPSSPGSDLSLGAAPSSLRAINLFWKKGFARPYGFCLLMRHQAPFKDLGFNPHWSLDFSTPLFIPGVEHPSCWLAMSK